MNLKNVKVRNKILLLALFIIAVFTTLILAYIIPTINNVVEERTVGKLSNLVDVPYTQVEYYYEKYQNGEMDEAEAKEKALNLIKNTRYNDVDYYWVHHYDGTMLMHPISEQLNGQIVTTIEDEKGKFLFKEMNDVVKANGEGTVDYWWPKPGADAPQPKLSYVKGFQPWEMVIGTGIYIDDLVALQRSIYIQVVVISIIIIIVSILLVGLIVIPLNKTLKGIIERVDEYKELDFRNDIAIQQDDELGEIAHAFNQVSEGIKSLLNTLQKISGALSKGAVSMDSDMRQLSANTDKTVLSSEEIASVIEQSSEAAQNVSLTVQEIRLAIDQVAEKATEGAIRASDINQRAVKMKEDADASGKKVVNIYDDMKTRLESAIKDADTVQKIDELLNSILSITEQTNLLALNASIEAARAGEAGRGFAVVANEVGSLAEQSKDMVANIQETVGSVKMAVNALIDDSTDILGFMEKQVLVDYEKLSGIGEQYNKDADIFNEIMTELSAISEELSGSMETISDNIENVAKASKKGTEGVNTILNMSKDVLANSQKVKVLIDESIVSVEDLDQTMKHFKI